MLAQEVLQDKCPLIASLVSLTFFIFLTIVFFVIVLINNKLLDDGVFMSFHMGALKSETFKIGVESPAVICLCASICYSILSAMSISSKWAKYAALVSMAVDSLIVPLLMCSLAMLNDLIQIVLMVTLYFISKISIVEMSSNASEYVPLRVYISACVATAVPWIVYTTGSIFNQSHIKRGHGAAQAIALVLAVYDGYKAYNKGGVIKHEFLIQMAARFILLICAFTQEF